MEGARCWRADWILGSKQICSLQWLSLDLGEPKAPKKLSELYVHEILYFFVSDKATNPSNRQEDWEYIMSFCDQINKELEGYGHVHLITPASPCTHNQIVCPFLVVNTQAFVFLTLLSLHCIV